MGYSNDVKFSSASVATAKKYDAAEDCGELTAMINKNLKAVRFSGNTYSEEACGCLASVLSDCTDLEYADCSDMFTTRLKTVVPPALRLLCDALEKTSITSLDVSDNALGKPGTQSVVKLLSKPAFISLRINNCGIGTAGALVLSNTFRNLLKMESIKAEDVKHEDLKEILEDSPFPAFTTEEEVQEIPLHVLIIGRSRLKVDGAEALSYGLRYLKNLRELDLASNSIPPEGLIAILEALQECTELEVLNLNDNSLKAEGVSALISLIQKLPKLRSLNIGDNSLEDSGCLEFLQGIKDSAPLLESLDMSYNEMNNDGATLLIELLKTKPNLASLELNGSCLSSATVDLLNEALSEHGHPDALGSMSDNEDEDDEDDDDEEDDD